MGFLHKLWDETLAGPAPDSGLGKLRKFNSFSGGALGRASSAPPSPTKFGGRNADANATDGGVTPVSRCITILRSNSTSAGSLNSTPNSSVPSSPASTACSSPFTPSTPRRNYKKQKKGKVNMEPSPTDYNWIVLSAWDR